MIRVQGPTNSTGKFGGELFQVFPSKIGSDSEWRAIRDFGKFVFCSLFKASRSQKLEFSWVRLVESDRSAIPLFGGSGKAINEQHLCLTAKTKCLTGDDKVDKGFTKLRLRQSKKHFMNKTRVGTSGGEKIFWWAVSC
jgi:hypothetical protein